MKRTRMQINVAIGLSEPHPLDGEIMKLAAQLRRLVRERAAYFCGKAHRGKEITPKHRAALSVAFKGRVFSPEWRAALSEAHTGKRRSPEQCEAISRGLERMWAKRRERA